MATIPGPYWVNETANGEHQVCGRHGAVVREYPAQQGTLADADCRKLQAGHLKSSKALHDAAPALLEAGEKINALAEMMQAEVTAFLHPDSEITNGDLINRLIYLLDGPEQRDAQGLLRAALSQAKGEQTNG